MRKRGRRQQQADAAPVRHPLMLYHNLARRYRPPGLLLFVMGLFALLPMAIPDLENDNVEPEALAGVGVVLILVGIAFWLFSIVAMRRSYVQCGPDLMTVRAPFYRTLVSYRRIKDVRAIPLKKLFEDYKFKGMGKPLMEPLMSDMAVVVEMRTWPAPKRRLKRFFSSYMFSPRKNEDAWVFAVPNYSILMRQIDEYRLRKLDEDRGKQGYEDPIDRLRHFSR